MIAIIDDLYAQRQIRIYKDYAPSLRSERSGLKVVRINKYPICKSKVRNIFIKIMAIFLHYLIHIIKLT